MKHYDKVGLDQTQRQHYICHYMVHATKDKEYEDEAFLKIKFNNLTGLTVRIYEGYSRDTALTPIVEFND